ncbi:hypothetical protein EV663_101394 [Rhodovulum bhavnagarense]|uniref:Uncharacterized protein n=1 Tax=Rhodovulum bhavnagarense TaxID=992286 RepID=A0A4R2RLL2_9RHOB|nr:hypothetical protein [Rhodovulum bhavnagarense]TCP63127.1 hypothetical protein EV663_101394 [Rhodovulum bhavnagarense]
MTCLFRKASHSTARWAASALVVALSFASATMTAGAAKAIERPGAVQLAQQNAAAREVRRKSMLELQVFRNAQTARMADGTALRLTSIKPSSNAWFLLEVTRPGRDTQTYHLENTAPHRRQVDLGKGPGPALVLTEGGQENLCRPWAGQDALSAAQADGLPFVPICDGAFYLRNPVRGARTNLERSAEFLRDNLAFGESVVGFVKSTLYKDKYLESGELIEGVDRGRTASSLGQAALREHPVMYTTMTFNLRGGSTERMEMGSWYAIEGAPGIYASALQPRMIHPDLLNRKGEANWLDAIEGRADVYLVGFDMGRFDIGFELGTEHPRLDWSSRPSGAGRNPSIPGPDGVASPAPLAMSGMINPTQAQRVAATFTGGFKRDHGAFRFGPKANYNHGHHYGFIVHGAVLSTLQPDLATFYVLDDGRIGMKTWDETDNAMLGDIRFARQNGVALIENGIPGPLVTSWGGGNWSGSAKAELRTLRAGACLKPGDDNPLLIYAWFSTATPSAMARTFQAYGCDYAMLLDMNALEHTYMALYTPSDEGGINTRHLVSGMANVDARRRDGSRVPRFVGYPDNRDFFYLLRKEGRQAE